MTVYKDPRNALPDNVTEVKFVLQPDGDVKEIHVVEESGFVPINAYDTLVPPAEFGSVDCGVTESHYGLHVSDTGRIARQQEQIKRMIFLLAECAEFLDGQADVLDSPDGPVPNRAMALRTEIDNLLVGHKL